MKRMFKICINAGHCIGVDPGAVGQHGTKEAEVVLEVGRLVEKYLQRVGCDTMLIQDDSLEYICDTANEYEADLFVSIHCNSAANPQANGTEIYTSRGETQADVLATCIMDKISDHFPDLYVRADWSDGDVDKEAGFYVLNNTDMPAVLVELAFISNEFEERLLSEELNQDLFARAIAVGVTDYLSR